MPANMGRKNPVWGLYSDLRGQAVDAPLPSNPPGTEGLIPGLVFYVKTTTLSS